MRLASCRPGATGGSACISGSPTAVGACWPHVSPASDASACVTTPPCGDGKIDPGEECDGEVFCSSCVIYQRLCCLTHDPDGGLTCRDFRYTPPGATEQFGHECHPGAVYAGHGTCSTDRQECLPEPSQPMRLCCERPGACANDRETGCAFRTGPYGPWDSLVVGRCGAGGRCRPRRPR